MYPDSFVFGTIRKDRPPSYNEKAHKEKSTAHNGLTTAYNVKSTEQNEWCIY